MAKPCKVLASPAYQTLTRAASASAAPPLTAAYVIRHQPSHQAPVSTTKCQRGWRWTHCRAAGRCLLHMPDTTWGPLSHRHPPPEELHLPNFLGFETGWVSCYLSAPVGRLCWSGGWC